MITSKVQLVKTLKVQLSSRIDRAINALLALYEKQTMDEQINKHTTHNNGVGFSSYDSTYLTSLAEQYKNKGFLTKNQQEALLRLMPKYASQLIDNSIAQGKIRKENGKYVW